MSHKQSLLGTPRTRLYDSINALHAAAPAASPPFVIIESARILDTYVESTGERPPHDALADLADLLLDLPQVAAPPTQVVDAQSNISRTEAA